MESNKTKNIVYKGKEKTIPVSNKNPKLCEEFIIAKMRYCKFEKFENSEFCIYHTPDKEKFLPCPIDPSHRVLAEKLKRHIKVCNKLGEQTRLQQSVWYKDQINKVNVIATEEIDQVKEYYNFK